MFIDAVCVLLFAWAVFKGLRNGLVLGVFSFLAFVVGLAAALKLSTAVATYLGTETNISERWLPFLAFAIVFLGVAFLIRLGAKAIEGLLRVSMLGWANSVGGIILYALIYLFIYSIILFYADQMNLIKPQTASASIVYPYLKPLAPKITNALGYVIPWFKNMFKELEGFFENRVVQGTWLKMCGMC